MRLLIVLRPSDFLEGWRLPVTLVAGAWQVTAVLARDLAGAQRAGSIFCAVPFERRSDRFGFLRRVLATAYTTVSPSSIVIGIDRRRGLILWHEIAHGEVSVMTKRLGAHA